MAALRAAHPELRDAQTAYQQLALHTSVEVDERGIERHESRAFLPERSAIPDWAPSSTPARPALQVDPTVASWVLQPSSTPDWVDLWLSTDRTTWNPVVSPGHEVALAMLAGRAQTAADIASVRKDAHQRRLAAGRAALAPLAGRLRALGADVTELHELSGTLRALVPRDSLAAVLQLPSVIAVEANVEVVDDAGQAFFVSGPTVDGFELTDLLQSDQYYEYGYYGSANLALVEDKGDKVRRSHPGFGDATHLSRFTNCGYSWFHSGCWGNPDPDPGGPHSTATASVLLGDITLAQDPDFVCTSWVDRRCKARSGVARGAHGLGVTNVNKGHAVGVISDPTRAIRIVSESQTAELGSNDVCAGTSAWDRDWNSLFESGIALFNSAGNKKHPDPTDCRTTSPADAIGVFTVAAYNVNAAHNEVDYLDNAMGGTTAEGRGRSIIDIAAPTDHEYPYAHDSTLASNYGAAWPDGSPPRLCCTSGATPAAAGAAELFRQWLDARGTGLGDNPGVLYANLLLMGDRTTSTGGTLSQGYDNIWGAGKLHLRKFDAAGMDAPAGWGTGSVCVANGQSVIIPMTSAPVSLDVDLVKATTWSYDHRHDVGVDHDKVDMYLDFKPAGWVVWLTIASDTSNDNKHRVYHQNQAQWDYRRRLQGRAVSSNAEGCGAASALVSYAYLWEDSDRDDDTYLQNHIRTE